MPDDVVLGEDADDFRRKCFAMYGSVSLAFDFFTHSVFHEVTLRSVLVQRSSENIPISCSHLTGNLLDLLNHGTSLKNDL